MPRGDRTGPAGMGPMTGRGAGYCAGFQVPGFANPVAGRGIGYGFGRGGRGGSKGRGGWGRRNMFYATGVPGWQRFDAGYSAYGGAVPYGGGALYGGPYGPAPTKEQELDMLKGQAEYIEKTLAEIGNRIEELESSEKKEGK